MELVYLGIAVVALLVQFIIYIVIQIKMFKNDSALKGIIGIITGGLFTYIWGWLKHKQLALTKVMILWTMVIIIPMALIPIAGMSAVMKFAQPGMQTQLDSKKKARLAQIKAKKKSAKKNKSANKAKKKRAARQKSKKAGQNNKNTNWGNKALALWKNDKFTKPKQAKTYLDKEIAKNPTAEVYNNRGNAHRNLQQYPQAMQDYNKAISIKPNFYKAYNNRGNVYFDQKNFQMAIKDYNKAISINRSYRYAYLNRGLAYYEMKKKNLACNDLKRACQLGDCDGLNWAKKNRICQ